MINIPSNTSSNLFSYVSQLFSDFWVVLVFAVGLPLTFYVLYRIVNALQGHTLDDFEPEDFEVYSSFDNDYDGDID